MNIRPFLVLSAVILSASNLAAVSFFGETAYNPPAQAGSETDAPYRNASDSAEGKLSKLIVPEVKFKQTPLNRVIGLLVQQSRELDPSGTGINVMLNTAKQNVPVTLSMKHATMDEVLRSVTDLCGLTYSVKGSLILIQDPPASE